MKRKKQYRKLVFGEIINNSFNSNCITDPIKRSINLKVIPVFSQHIKKVQMKVYFFSIKYLCLIKENFCDH